MSDLLGRTKDVGFAAGSPPDMGDQLARRIFTSPTTRDESFGNILSFTYLSVVGRTVSLSGRPGPVAGRRDGQSLAGIDEM
ncbi:hypothetical protein AB0C12_00130 [Actinoplanes sp. NPDC048967]|uniref:hypothetical protein n=1 Tax=Actinoplanes sp. NPDC048967 TaxID=3155269 RepID=UPI00340FBCDD